MELKTFSRTLFPLMDAEESNIPRRARPEEEPESSTRAIPCGGLAAMTLTPWSSHGTRSPFPSGIAYSTSGSSPFHLARQYPATLNILTSPFLTLSMAMQSGASMS